MQSFIETLLFPLLHALILLVLLFIFKWLFANSTTKKNLPPSPPRLPIIGNLHQLGRYPNRSLRTLSKKYGDLILLQLGSKPTIIISSAELASQVLKTHDAVFASRPNLSVFRRLLGNGNDIVSSPYDEYWKQRKSICVHELLNTNKVNSYRSVREEEMQLLVKEIERFRVVDLSKMFRAISNDVICRVTFGKKYNEDDPSGIDFPKLLSEFIELLGGHYVGDFVSWLGWIDRISGVNGKVNKVAKTFDELIEGILRDRMEFDKGSNDPRMVTDFLDVLLQVQRRQSGGNRILDKNSIKGVILDMFAAATEATFIALEWMMSLLIKNPRVMRILQREIRSIIGDKKTVTEDCLQNMKYLKAVFKETLRLYTPGPFLVPHESTRDVELNGYHISAGTQVVVNAWSICRDPRYWEKSESFVPERFLGSLINFKGQDFEYIPFGSGRRMCPGMKFGMVTVELIIANLVHRFDWSLPNGKDIETLDVREATGLVMRKKIPLVVVASPRT